MKLTLRHSKLQNKNFTPFPQLNAFLNENKLDVKESVFEVMKRHISILSKEIWHDFPDLEYFQKYCRFVNNLLERELDISLHTIIYFKNSLLIW